MFSFIGIATVVPDLCPDYVKNSDIGKYIFNQSILSLSVYVILNTENGAWWLPFNTNWKVKYVAKDYRNDEYEAGWLSSSFY